MSRIRIPYGNVFVIALYRTPFFPCRAPLERLARYASDVEHKMLMEESRVKRAVEKGSKDPPIAPRHITHDPTITLYRWALFVGGMH